MHLSILKKKKKKDDNALRNIRNLFRLKKENQAIKDSVIRDIRNLSELEENYYKPVKEENVWSNNYIEY